MTQTIPSSLFFKVSDIVRSEFEIKDSYLDETTPTFLVVPPQDFEARLQILRSKLRSQGLELVVKPTEAGILLLVFTTLSSPSHTTSFPKLNYPLILFIATVITVAISGYLTSSNYLTILKVVGRNVGNETVFLIEQTTLYTIATMSIVGLHELGHMLACRRNHIEASFPIFIPGIPGVTLGTFGAIIRQKEQVRNRNQLFDIGFSGPFVGFITSLIVSAIGFALSLPVSYAEYLRVSSQIGPAEFIYLPLLSNLLAPYLMPSSSSYTHFLHPLALAGWMGTLITFLNAFPIGQLDGGHVARSILSDRGSRIVGYIAVGGMILMGWWSMALLVIFLVRINHPSLLDDVSPLSRGRKILALVFVAIFVACFTISPM